jgi:2-polyprenyl-6-methoxyphenol hydroxylase-like FAD-dependent oxidoreductase
MHDVVIAGAGPVGLALALDLGARGIRSVVVERKSGTGIEIEAKASVLNERTMEFCRRLGIRDEVANAGYPQNLAGDTVYCTALHDKYIGRLVMPSFQERDLPEQSSEMLQRCPQCWFDPVLARAVLCQGMSTVRYGTEVIRATQDDKSVAVFLENVNTKVQEVIETRYLVACDGPASGIRLSLDIPFQGQDLGHTLSAIVEIDLNGQHLPFDRPAERYMFVGPEGTWGNFTAVDGRNLWRFSVVGLEGKIDKDTFDISLLVKKALGREDIEFRVKRVLKWRRSQYTAKCYGKGRILLAGDAAHTMSPTGGHGLSTGLGDVSDLSWMLQALIEGWGGPGLLRAYQIERRPIAFRNGKGSTKNFAVWKDGEGRDKLLAEGPDADEQRRRVGENMVANMRQEFQAIGLALGYDYADSPLVVSDGSPAPANEPELYVQTARPGHRAPHCWLSADRSTIDLFGDGFVLLRFGEGHPDDQTAVLVAREIGVPLRLLEVADTRAAALYQRRLVLVRPDGMVA